MFAIRIDNEGDEVVCRTVEVDPVDQVTVLRVVEERWRKPREQWEAEQAAWRAKYPEEVALWEQYMPKDEAGQ